MRAQPWHAAGKFLWKSPGLIVLLQCGSTSGKHLMKLGLRMTSNRSATGMARYERCNCQCPDWTWLRDDPQRPSPTYWGRNNDLFSIHCAKWKTTRSTGRHAGLGHRSTSAPSGRRLLQALCISRVRSFRPSWCLFWWQSLEFDDLRY